MELDKEMEEALNDQINAEFFSEYIYLAMAAHFEEINFSGFASWMKKQAAEEHEHGMKIFDHIVERGGRVKLKQINQPPYEWNSIEDVFELTYNHEKSITARINKLVDLAQEKKDHATRVMLDWFVKEQVEEEATANDILQKVKMMGDLLPPMLMLDKKLGKRE